MTNTITRQAASLCFRCSESQWRQLPGRPRLKPIAKRANSARLSQQQANRMHKNEITDLVGTVVVAIMMIAFTFIIWIATK